MSQLWYRSWLWLLAFLPIDILIALFQFPNSGLRNGLIAATFVVMAFGLGFALGLRITSITIASWWALVTGFLLVVAFGLLRWDNNNGTNHVVLLIWVVLGLSRSSAMTVLLIFGAAGIVGSLIGGLGLVLGAAIGNWGLNRWRALRPMGIYVVAAVVLFLIGAGGVIPDRHTDNVMIQNFWKHEAKFNQLVDMSNEDAGLGRIAPTFIRPLSSGAAEISQERWDEYRALFKELDLRHGISRGGEGSIGLEYWATGMVTGGSYKGYVYSENELSPIINSLDKPSIPVKSMVPIYRKIKDSWYLYYMWDD